MHKLQFVEQDVQCLPGCKVSLWQVAEVSLLQASKQLKHGHWILAIDQHKLNFDRFTLEFTQGSWEIWVLQAYFQIKKIYSPKHTLQKLCKHDKLLGSVNVFEHNEHVSRSLISSTGTLSCKVLAISVKIFSLHNLGNIFASAF